MVPFSEKCVRQSPLLCKFLCLEACLDRSVSYSAVLEGVRVKVAEHPAPVVLFVNLANRYTLRVTEDGWSPLYSSPSSQSTWGMRGLAKVSDRERFGRFLHGCTRAHTNKNAHARNCERNEACAGQQYFSYA